MAKIPKFNKEASIDSTINNNTPQSVIKALQAKGSVIKDGGEKTKPTLDSNEQSRYKAIFTIARDILQPKEEAQRIGGTTKEEIKTTPIASSMMSLKGLKSPNLKGLGIMGALALLPFLDKLFSKMEEGWGDIKKALIDIMRALRFSSLMLKLGPISKALMKVGAIGGEVFKVIGNGMMSVLKGVKALKVFTKPLSTLSKVVKPMAKGGGMLLKMASTIGGKMLKLLKMGAKGPLRFVPILGSIVSFMEAYRYLSKGEPSGKDIALGMANLVSGVLNLLPSGVGNVASGLIDGVILFSELTSGEGGRGEVLAPIKEKGGEIIKNLGMGIVNKVTSLFKDLTTWLSDSISGFFTNIKDGLLEGLGLKEKMEAKSDVKGVGSSGFFMAPYTQPKKINDGIVYKDGQVTSFNSEDDVLATKKDGPIDKLLSGRSDTNRAMASIQGEQLSVQKKMLKMLEMIYEQGGQDNFNGVNLKEEFYAT